MAPLPGVLVDPAGQTLSVTILSQPSGRAATAYSDQNGQTPVSLPTSISARTVFYLGSEGAYTVNGQAFTVEQAEIATVSLSVPYQSGAFVGRAGGTTAATSPLPFFNVKDYGAKGDNTTDDTAAIQAAVNAAAGGAGGNLGGTVIIPPGQYVITSPISYTAPTTNLTAVQGPSIIGVGQAGRVGDTTEAGSVQLVCGATFPIGAYAVDFISGSTSTAGPIAGVVLHGFGVTCNSRGAGVRIAGGRRCRITNVNTDHSVTPSPSVTFNGSTGAIVMERNGNANAAAYNVIDDCSVYIAGTNGIVADDNGVCRVSRCFVIQAAQYNYLIGDYAAGTNLHSEGAGVADVYMTTHNTLLDGFDFFSNSVGGYGPKQSNIVILGDTSTAQPGSCRIANCTFMGTVGTGLTVQQASMVQFLFAAGGTTEVVMDNCTFFAQSATSYFLYFITGLTGNVLIDNCDFVGTPVNGLLDLNGFTGLTVGPNPLGINGSANMKLYTTGSVEIGDTAQFLSIQDNGGGGVDVNNTNGAIRLYSTSNIVARVPIQTQTAQESTGAGSALLGANSPATTLAAPYKWLKFVTNDGSTVYVPAWK